MNPSLLKLLNSIVYNHVKITTLNILPLILFSCFKAIETYILQYRYLMKLSIVLNIIILIELLLIIFLFKTIKYKIKIFKW